MKTYCPDCIADNTGLPCPTCSPAAKRPVVDLFVKFVAEHRNCEQAIDCQLPVKAHMTFGMLQGLLHAILTLDADSQEAAQAEQLLDGLFYDLNEMFFDY
jgi:hypothetical protein